MADLLQADTIQQLEVALLGAPASHIIKVLAGGLTSSSSPVGPTQPCSKVLTLTPPAPPPTSVPVLGLSTTSLTPRVVPASSSESDVVITELAVPKPKETKASDVIPS